MAVNECFCFFCVWLDSSGASSPIELWESSGVLCLIELLWGAAARCVFSLIELFLGPVEAWSARQSPLIFFNDVASVFVNFHTAAARRGLLWLTSQKDKRSSLLDADKGTITSTLPKEHRCYQWISGKLLFYVQKSVKCRRSSFRSFALSCWPEERFEKFQHCARTVCVEIKCSFTKFLRRVCETVDDHDEGWERAKSAYHFLTVIFWSLATLCLPICVFTLTLRAWHSGTSHHV